MKRPLCYIIAAWLGDLYESAKTHNWVFVGRDVSRVPRFAFMRGTIRTKIMVAEPDAAQNLRLMFEMYAEPQISFGNIVQYFSEQDITVYGKSPTKCFLSQLLRNPAYV